MITWSAEQNQAENKHKEHKKDQVPAYSVFERRIKQKFIQLELAFNWSSTL